MSSYPLKAILVDTEKGLLSEVEIKSTECIYRHLECQTFAVGGRLPTGDTVYIDDEGLLVDPQTFFIIDRIARPLAGKGLIIGSDDAGNGRDVKIKIHDLSVGFMSRKEILPFLRKEQEWADRERSNPDSQYCSITTMNDVLGDLDEERTTKSE